MPPIYTTPSTALLITPTPTVPYSETIDNSANIQGVGFPSNCDITQYVATWLTYIAQVGDTSIAITLNVDNTGNYTPYMSVWKLNGSVLEQYTIDSQDFCSNMGFGGGVFSWFQVPIIPGVQYWFQVTSVANIVPNKPLPIIAYINPRTVAPAGSLVVQSDVEPYPAPIWAIDGTVLQVRNFPPGEFTDTIPNGYICTQNDESAEVVGIYNPQLVAVATYNLPTGFGLKAIKSDRDETFYVFMSDGGPIKIVSMGIDAVPIDEWDLPANSEDAITFAVTQDGTKCYYSGDNATLSVPIYTYDLVNSVALSNLHAGFASERPFNRGDSFCLANGSLVIGFTNAGNTTGTMRVISSAGAVVHAHALAIGLFVKLHHYCYRDETTIGVWMEKSGNQDTTLGVLTLATGAYVGTPFEIPAGAPGSSSFATPWAISSSCPIFALSAELATGPIAAPLSGIYRLIPDKRNDTLYTSYSPVESVDVAIPNPHAVTGYLLDN